MTDLHRDILARLKAAPVMYLHFTDAGWVNVVAMEKVKWVGTSSEDDTLIRITPLGLSVLGDAVRPAVKSHEEHEGGGSDAAE